MAKRNRRGIGSVCWRKEANKSEGFVFAGLYSNVMETDKEKGVAGLATPLVIWYRGLDLN